jgi:prohibitin 1
MKQGSLASLAVIGIVSLIVIITLSNSIFLTIEAGERGVVFKRFSGGLDKENIYVPGFHVIAPWNTMYIYNVREQQLDEKMTVLSNNGLNIAIDLTVRVRPKYTEIGGLHERFGNDYMTTLVRPEIRSSARKIFGRFQPEELYSTKRDQVQTMIEEDLRKNLGKNEIELQAVLIRDIELPAKVRNAIEEKLEAEQAALKYEFILNRERQEAERKIIEAEAKARSNQILNASLSANILKDKGIEATIKLAESPNSKVIVVGGSDGLPLILGGQ